MFEAARATGHITALTDGEIVQGVAILVRALAMFGMLGAPSAQLTGVFDSVGGLTAWGAIGLLIAVPQLAGWVLAWFGVKPHHEIRLVLLSASTGWHLALAAAWLSFGAGPQVVMSLMFGFLSWRAVSRVWAYNGIGAPRWSVPHCD